MFNTWSTTPNLQSEINIYGLGIDTHIINRHVRTQWHFNVSRVFLLILWIANFSPTIEADIVQQILTAIAMKAREKMFCLCPFKEFAYHKPMVNNITLGLMLKSIFIVPFWNSSIIVWVQNFPFMVLSGKLSALRSPGIFILF